MKKYKKIAMLMCSLGLMFLVTGITYAYFNYTKTGDENVLITGDIYMNLEEGNDQISLTNIFPETKEEARARNDNEITFTINGLNTSSKTVYYEIDLTYGDDLSGYTRFNDSDLMFDLVEVGSNNEETYVVNARSFNTLDNKKIWVDTVDGGIDTEIERTYKLRMWLKDSVIISDTDPNASYPATGTNAFKNHFASVRVRVIGDFTKKERPRAYDMIADSADTVTLIDFGRISSSTNGKGLYRLPGTENDEYPIYYYRGDVGNNNVLFGGYCWQMVRTTDTGGIRMIYNGKPDISEINNNTAYNCGVTRTFQNETLTRKDLRSYSGDGYYYSNEYEIIKKSENLVNYRLISPTLVKITNATEAESIIPIIASSYPYTCFSKTADAVCETFLKVDSYYGSGTAAYVYDSRERYIMANEKFNTQSDSVSDVGYMSNARYTYTNAASPSGSIFGKDVEWNGSNYLVIENTAHTASTNTTKDNYHHYSCGTNGTTSCTSVRYYFYNDYYIILTNGENIEDALYKMTGNGNDAVISRNSNYVLNQNDSAIKIVIENWFRTNLTNEMDETKTDYRPYIEDSVYCNNRSYSSVESYEQSGWNPNGGDLTKKLDFGSTQKYLNSWYNTTSIPNLSCPNETDRFSVGSTVAHLNYSIGLLTADEVLMAGGLQNTMTYYEGNYSYYLHNSAHSWLISPWQFYPNSTINEGFVSLGINAVGNIFPVRPAISLKLGVEFEPDGDGTPTNPYIVKYN